ncbi:MAG: hypothetical protein LBK67_02270 [Coriobacteriales bacterium]|jgi:hypothetical protein|nr:hypothetical protein [Coriobacteriales bacterium]
MRISVSRKEETSFAIDQSFGSNFEPNLPDFENLMRDLHHGFAKPQCCVRCIESDESCREEGDCPCPDALSSL